METYCLYCYKKTKNDSRFCNIKCKDNYKSYIKNKKLAKETAEKIKLKMLKEQIESLENDIGEFEDYE